MSNINRFLVHAMVDSKDYLVNVIAESESAAEHYVLDMGICGRHEYGVEAAQAFDFNGMKTDFFRNLALLSDTVSMNELLQIVDKRNHTIRQKDAAEDRIREIEAQMKQLQKDLEEAKRTLGEN